MRLGFGGETRDTGVKIGVGGPRSERGHQRDGNGDGKRESDHGICLAQIAETGHKPPSLALGRAVVRNNSLLRACPVHVVYENTGGIK